ncbi:Cupredoxin [Gautieria morchelliformis]|nr:Cupredoxin [Gautieria morchelliformis]
MRFFSTALALAAIPAAVLGEVHTVTVGAGGQLAFNPSNITAAAGDQINFEFQAKNHSATQSTFASPCTKAMFNGSLGVNSGFMPIPANSTIANGSFPTWSITINNTTPLWFYCAQKTPVSHCQMGMVFSINATPQKSFDTFLVPAKASANSTAAPGGMNATSASGAAASGASGSASASQAASNASPSVSPNPNGASKVLSTRGAAGLLTIVAIGAMLL